MKSSMILFAAIVLWTGLVAGPATAEAPKVVTWNINGGEQDEDILAGHALDMMLDIGDFDIIVLQEVISLEQVARIAEKIGFEHWAISDFSPPVEITEKWFASLEVAVLSRTPFVKVSEWDTTGKLPNGDAYDPRSSDPDVPTESLDLGLTISDAERPSRGFLRVDFADGLSVYATHWKSSGNANGDDDLENAAKRENNARGIAKDASDLLASGRSILVAGNFNIQPIGKHVRVGTDVTVDCTPSLGNCGSGGLDGYDDSMKIVSDIGNGFRLLSADIAPTYLAGDFGPGAIDHIFVAGPLAPDSAVASTISIAEDRYFGSDHAPVFSRVGPIVDRETDTDVFDTNVAAERDAKIRRLVREVRERLDILEQMASENR